MTDKEVHVYFNKAEGKKKAYLLCAFALGSQTYSSEQ